ERRFWWFVGKGLLVERLSEEWFPKEGEFLDLGCGTGANLDRVEGRGKWTGADLSPRAVSFCAERGHRLLVLSEAGRLPFRDGSLDGAMALDLFEHLEDDRATVTELTRCLRPGGRVLVTVPAYPFLWSSHDVAMGHFRRYSRGSLMSLLSGAGLIILKVTHFPGLLFPALFAGRMFQKFAGDAGDTISYDWPGFANRSLIAFVRLELSLLSRFSMPWGTTLAAVCEKPSGEFSPGPDRRTSWPSFRS
ncbi:MAG: class I SAM-dependent methyltransferase, partial [bacterium]